MSRQSALRRPSHRLLPHLSEWNLIKSPISRRLNGNTVPIQIGDSLVGDLDPITVSIALHPKLDAGETVARRVEGYIPRSIKRGLEKHITRRSRIGSGDGRRIIGMVPRA